MICDAVMAVLLKGFVVLLHLKLETTLSLQRLLHLALQLNLILKYSIVYNDQDHRW